jgi:cob(I)alamin adenosyltransferase
MKIYTRTGDGGETGLWGGGRISKDAARIHAYGTIDECNAAIGAARTFKPDPELDKMLETIQSRLFVAGADLATPGDKETAIERIKNKDAAELEGWIDRLEESLPKLKQFIIPGGTSVAASLHLARTVCRRAERWAVTLVAQDETHRPALVFLNRLSDFLFVAARKANHSAGLVDLYWQKPQGKAGS